MNKIIDENHLCTFCHSTRKPFPDGVCIRCPTCNMPQYEGVIYEPDVPVLELACFHCRRTVEKPSGQIRLSADECGGVCDVIIWTCPNCEKENGTPDDLTILSADIIEVS